MQSNPDSPTYENQDFLASSDPDGYTQRRLLVPEFAGPWPAW